MRAEWWAASPFAGGDTRSDAGRILRAGLSAADPEAAVVRELTRRAADLEAARIFILAVGKAAAGMARGALAVLPRIDGGLVVVPAGERAAPTPLVTLAGDHPLPSTSSLAAGHAVRTLASGLTGDELVLCLVSGGASSLLAQPLAGLELADLRAVTERLLAAGAPIAELNAVRKHLDALKGGRLARALAPARALALLISDVPGDDPAVIASGPLSADPTGWPDVADILDRYLEPDAVPAAVRTAVENGLAGRRPDTLKPGDPALADVQVEIIVSARHTVSAAAEAARVLGYRVETAAGHAQGEARRYGRSVAEALVAGEGRRALLSAGETTVRVVGSGRGGRNQEVALGAVEALSGRPRHLVAAFATDGVDGPTDAAGAVATGTTLERARTAGLDPATALADNDAWTFFDTLGDLIRTGPTGTNVMDLTVGLAGA